MSWVKIDDHLSEHPKFMAAGPEASWLFVCGLCYCARNLTDGFIPTSAILRLADLPDPKAATIALVKAKLWQQAPDGIWVHDYLAYNPSRLQVMEARDKNATKLQRWRDKQAQRNGHDEEVEAHRYADVFSSED